MHLSYVGFVLLSDLLGNIGGELKIQKLPAKVPGVISIYFRSESCWARQLLTPLATFAFLAVALISPHVSLVTLMMLSEIHRDDGQHHSPPAALPRQFCLSGAQPKKLPSLRDCCSPDGNLDIQKYLQRQAAVRKWSRWRTSTALNLAAGFCESLSVVRAVQDAAPAIKKTRAPRCVYGWKESADSELQIITPKECQWYKMYVSNFLMMEASSMRLKFCVRFQLPYPNCLDLLSG